MVTPVKKGILEAGKHAELAVTVYDQYGNVTEDLAGHSVVATAHGPATVQFLETAAGVYRYQCAYMNVHQHAVICIWSLSVIPRRGHQRGPQNAI